MSADPGGQQSGVARNILLAVGGGIAAYKSAVLCSRLVQQGHEVRVVMTEAATQFVGEATFAALSGKPVVSAVVDSRGFPLGPHIELADGIDLMVVAPATANLLAKMATGVADDLVTTLYLQVTCRVLAAPAMSDPMWKKPAVRRNVQRLRDDGCHLVGPERGWLSCRVLGEGRMSEPDEILCAINELLEARGDNTPLRKGV
jgi:phosphopantothenoylcysteine decarboxylase/phosphopantothenate--cysteine ligase